MNGTRTNTRRRANVSSSSASPTKCDGVDESIYKAGSNGQSNNGGRRKSHEPKLHGQVNRFARRKGKIISRIIQMCGKIGKLRVVDVVLFIGVAAKLASMLYSRRTPSSSSSMQHSARSDSAILEHGPRSEEVKTLSDNWSPPKWVKRWMEHKMPFHSPLLYRREDDDYSFGYDSYLDDDEDVDRKERKNIRFKGMLFPREHYEDIEEQVNGHGYAVVDDVLYHIDEYREWTEDALPYAEFQLNHPGPDDTVDNAKPAFEFSNNVKEQRHYITDDEGFDTYYAMDDDNLRGTYGTGMAKPEEEYEEEYEDESGDSSGPDFCSVPTFLREYYPNCNEMHAEVSGYQWLIGEEIYSRRWKKKKQLSFERSHLNKYIGHGYYRDAFMFQPLFVPDSGEDKPTTQRDEVVFKTMRHMYESETETGVHEDDFIEKLGLGWDPEEKYTFMEYKEYMRMDAMLLELLTSSPRAANIYSHCAMSSMIEFAPVDIEEYILPTGGGTPKQILRRGAKHESKLEAPLNDHISPEEKLEIALEMAKCIAVMHGFKDGPIAHVDVQIGQFFRGRDGFIKLVDYNRAEPILYNEEKEEYCKWINGPGGDGTYRAPEENSNRPLTEKMDVYSLGNVFYSILTGKLVWDQYELEVTMERIITGDTMEIEDFYRKSTNSRTRILVRAIESCWTTDAKDRPSIFQVVDFLERARLI
eukprot:CAMPEP_0172305380 /NCGR_PEP_ID=MMETSP1058-20130122/6681_1 /TAXON_ID=83371 /ORGANISM="Detonula confervacea, Strain CCMP 353" /LENGTH=697 /DNA_ID=CAMNT_0013016963 /DNA_START=1 /DNA_END=2094 /DNA_ORIENTATION=+